jgi:hypothetical protein
MGLRPDRALPAASLDIPLDRAPAEAEFARDPLRTPAQRPQPQQCRHRLRLDHHLPPRLLNPRRASAIETANAFIHRSNPLVLSATKGSILRGVRGSLFHVAGYENPPTLLRQTRPEAGFASLGRPKCPPQFKIPHSRDARRSVAGEEAQAASAERTRLM